jgi:thioredoxin 1
MSNANVISVSDASFDADVLGAAGPVLVKFEAEWCGPCKAMKPMIQDLAQEFGDRLTVATLDIDQNNQTPYRFGVRGVPTVILFDKGKVVGQKVGLPRKADLADMIRGQVS